MGSDEGVIKATGKKKYAPWSEPLQQNYKKIQLPAVTTVGTHHYNKYREIAN